MPDPSAMKARLRAPRDDVLNIAHRGVWDPLPENSAAAIEAAAEYDIAEIDVQVAADGGLVVHHDTGLGRMTGRAGALADMTAAELTALTLRQGKGGEAALMTDHSLPDLGAALSAAPELMFDLDAKNAEETRAVALGAAALGAADRVHVKVDVANAEDLAALLQLERDTHVMVAAKITLRGARSLDLIEAVRDADVALAEVWFDDLALLSLAARRAGPTLRLSTYTLDPVHCCGLNDTAARRNPSAVWGVLIDAGITAIMTDEPAALRTYLAAL
ncbi:MAG: glycerophosphodiester phosphodiesterase family protein [Pseudomonadota bacterium]